MGRAQGHRIKRGVAMMRVFILLAVIAISGCAAAPTMATAPIAVPCPKPPVIMRPSLPTSALTAQSSDQDVIRAYVISDALLKGYAEKLEIIIDGYR